DRGQIAHDIRVGQSVSCVLTLLDFNLAGWLDQTEPYRCLRNDTAWLSSVDDNVQRVVLLPEMDRHALNGGIVGGQIDGVLDIRLLGAVHVQRAVDDDLRRIDRAVSARLGVRTLPL